MLEKFNGYGLRDSKTKEIVVPAEYDEIKQIKGGWSIVSKQVEGEETLSGVVSEEGRMIFPVEYEYITDFSRRGFMNAVKGNQMGFLFKDGTEMFFGENIMPTGYAENNMIILEDTETHKYACARIDGKQYCLLTDFKYDYIEAFHMPDRARVCYDGYEGFINTRGEEIFETKYIKVKNLSRKLVFLKDELKSCIMDENKNVVFPDVVEVKERSDFMIKGAFLIRFKDNTCCLIDGEGNVYGKRIYSDIERFNNGVAIVKKENKVGVINMDFKEIIMPKELEEGESIKYFNLGLTKACINGKSFLINKNGILEL